MIRQVVALDTETRLIETGVLDPELACLSIATGGEKILLSATDSPPAARALLENEEVDLVLQNGAFDLGVLIRADPSLLPLIFAALDAGRIKDTMIREKLLRLELGELKFRQGKKTKFSLAALVERYFGVNIEETKSGSDSWRLRYGELIDVPLEEWPKEAKDYAIDDAVWTLKVYEAQGGAITNEDEQARAAFGLHLMTIRGLKTDLHAVDRLRESLTPKIEELHEILTTAGILRPVKKTKDLKVLRALISAAYEARGESPPLTPSGAVSTARETLTESGNDILQSLGELSNAEKLLKTYIPTLEEGIVNPGYGILMESGRVSSFRPNIQNVPRMGGVRECYVPRGSGEFVFVACDYSTLELCALAQVCLDLFGFSRMADAINAGEDLHQSFADDAGCSRQASKAANFGYPGGLGATSFASYAKNYGVEITESEAVALKERWLERWPEVARFFRHVAKIASVRDSFPITQLRSGRVRGGCNYTSACNTYFQGLAADLAKEAVFETSRRCYLESLGSPLFGSFPVAFIHDEIIIEAPVDRWREAAEELSRVMVAAAKNWIPDVAIRADPAGMLRWYKDAEEVRDEDGVLQLWEPSQ